MPWWFTRYVQISESKESSWCYILILMASSCLCSYPYKSLTPIFSFWMPAFRLLVPRYLLPTSLLQPGAPASSLLQTTLPTAALLILTATLTESIPSFGTQENFLWPWARICKNQRQQEWANTVLYHAGRERGKCSHRNRFQDITSMSLNSSWEERHTTGSHKLGRANSSHLQPNSAHNRILFLVLLRNK